MNCYVNLCLTHVVSITTHLRRSDEQLPELDISDVRGISYGTLRYVPVEK